MYYMYLQERLLSSTHGYPDPVNPTYESTGSMYDGVCELLLRDLSTTSSLGFLVVATHNEASVLRAVGKAEQLGLLEDGQARLAFAQIYGMAEQISLPLGNKTGLSRSAFLY